MPQAILFQQYLAKCFDRLQKSLEEYESSHEKGLLFRLRVSIKKIRSCLACMEYLSGEAEFRKARRQFRKMFRIGGKLRELEIYYAWFRSNHFLRISRMIKLPEQTKAREKAFLHNSEKMKSEISGAREITHARATQLLQEEILQFYTYLLPTVLPFRHTKLAKDKWHATRKQLKRVLYARHWQDEQGLKILSKRQAVYLDQLQHLFGYWNDNKEMILWLRDQHEKNKKRLAPSREKGAGEAFGRALDLLKERGEKCAMKVNEKLSQGSVVLGPFARRLGNLSI